MHSASVYVCVCVCVSDGAYVSVCVVNGGEVGVD